MNFYTVVMMISRVSFFNRLISKAYYILFTISPLDENRGNDCNDNVDIRRKDATFQLSLSPVSSPPRTLTSITKNMNTSNIFTPFRDMSNNASGAVNSMPGSIDPELPTPFREMGTIHQLCL